MHSDKSRKSVFQRLGLPISQTEKQQIDQTLSSQFLKSHAMLIAHKSFDDSVTIGTRGSLQNLFGLVKYPSKLKINVIDVNNNQSDPSSPSPTSTRSYSPVNAPSMNATYNGRALKWGQNRLIPILHLRKPNRKITPVTMTSN